MQKFLVLVAVVVTTIVNAAIPAIADSQDVSVRISQEVEFWKIMELYALGSDIDGIAAVVYDKLESLATKNFVVAEHLANAHRKLGDEGKNEEYKKASEFFEAAARLALTEKERNSMKTRAQLCTLLSYQD